jgi:predicted metal-binding protein
VTTRKVKARWKGAVLVCSKCSKKIKKGGFGPDGDKPLAKALRKHLHLGKGPKSAAGIIEVPCLDVCPKRAILVVDGRHPDQWLIVHPGANLDGLAHELGLKGDIAKA